MKFSKAQQDYLKHCGEHFELLTGGRQHSKTKQVIEDMQQEIERLNNIIDELEKWLQENIKISKAHDNQLGVNVCNTFLDKLKELKNLPTK